MNLTTKNTKNTKMAALAMDREQVSSSERARCARVILLGGLRVLGG
jgi:hypothetical protein